MGIKSGVCFEEKNVGEETGDNLLMYTDGVTEAKNAYEELFDTEWLGRFIAVQNQRHPPEIKGAILEELAIF